MQESHLGYVTWTIHTDHSYSSPGPFIQFPLPTGRAVSEHFNCFTSLAVSAFLKMQHNIMFVCLGLTSLSTLSVISRRCLVVTGSSMLTFIVLPHCGIRSQTLLPDTTPSHIILTPEQPVLAPYPENSSDKQGATSTIVNDFGLSQPGIKPGTSRSRSGHSTY